MPLRLLFFLVVCCLLFPGCRKDLLHWNAVEQIPVAGNIQLNTALFLPDGTGIIGGGSRFEKGQILVSADGGKTWQGKNMPDESKGFFGSAIAPDGKVYFIGHGLNTCSSADAMSTHRFGRIPGPYEFSGALSLATAHRGIAVTNQQTDSGGIVVFDDQLNLLSFQRVNNALHDILMFNNRTGIAVGSGIVLKTTDSGNTWTRLAVSGDNFNSISATDSNHIWISGLSGYIFATTNGGASWKRLRNGGDITLPDYQLWDLLFTSPAKGYAVGEKGILIYTEDGGEHWVEFDRFTSQNLRFITLCPDGHLLTGGENGTLFRLQPK